MSWHGLTTALITPFSDDKIDEPGLRTLVQRQIEGGVDGLVILGTTGEAASLTLDERERVIRITLEENRGRLPIMVGTGTYSTEDTISLTRHAMKMGANAVLVVAPYYVKPTQEGLYGHYARIADAVDIPMMIYHHPGRTAVTMEASTILRLAQIDTIFGIKECSGGLELMQQLIEHRPSDFRILAGDDNLAFSMMALGADGLVSVLSNLLPEGMNELIVACRKGNLQEARTLHYALRHLYAASSLESNPICIKALMRLANLPAGNCRLPMTGPTESNLQKLQLLMSHESKSPH